VLFGDGHVKAMKREQIYAPGGGTSGFDFDPLRRLDRRKP
jgi:hypothetical protein